MNVLIRILVYNRPGVLDRIAGIVRRRGWNIDGLTIGMTAENLMQINLSIDGQHIDVPEFGHLLSEMHDVESWEECSAQHHFVREMLLLSYRKDSGQSEVISGISGIRTIKEDEDGRIYAEYTGSPEETAAKYDLLQKNSVYCIRAGKIVLAREGDNSKNGRKSI